MEYYTYAYLREDGTPYYGRKWWNNGVESIMSRECPGKNYILGRLINK